jgi:hypothetical protein
LTSIHTGSTTLNAIHYAFVPLDGTNTGLWRCFGFVCRRRHAFARAAAFVGGERFQRVAEVLAHVADVFVFSLSEDVVAYRVFRNLFRLGIRISSVCVIIFCGIL